MKLNDLVKAYCYEKVLSKDTVLTYERRAKAFDERIVYNHVMELDKEHAFQWRDILISEGVRNTTINNYIRHCRVLWKFGLDQGLVPQKENIFKIPKLPEIALKKDVSQQTIQQAIGLLNTNSAWFWRAVIATQAELGIRDRQLINIKLSDVCFDEETIYCCAEGNKMRKENLLPITPLVKQVLVEYLSLSRTYLGRDLRPHEYLFEIARYDRRYKRKRNRRMTTDQLQGMYSRLSDRVKKITGERISGHRLRHTLACRIGSRSDVNIRVIQEWFGWNCIQTAEGYIKVSLEQKRALINYN